MSTMTRPRHLAAAAIAVTLLTAACSNEPDIVTGSGTNTAAPATTVEGSDTSTPAPEDSSDENGTEQTSDSTGDTDTESSIDDSSDGGGGGGGATVGEPGNLVVVVDGWSYASLDPDAVEFTDGTTRTNISFRPLTGTELTALTERRPDTLELLAARMVTASATLTCTSTSCRWGTNTVDVDTLADATAINGLGASYSGYNITHLAWAAVMPAPSGTLHYGTSTFDVGAIDNTRAEQLGIDPNGGVVVVATAFGQLFANTPTWNTDTPRLYDDRPATGTANPDMVARIVADGAVLTHGLGTPVDGLAYTPSQATFSSSPTTGCGVGVICVPGVYNPKPSTTAGGQIPLCSPDGNPAGTVLFATFDITTPYPAPTHQFGITNGITPDGTLGALWESAPPLVEQAEQRHIVAYHIDSNGLVEIAGLDVHLGKDDPILADTTLNTDTLERLFGNQYVPCGN
jgi:hypothetical protein